MKQREKLNPYRKEGEEIFLTKRQKRIYYSALLIYFSGYTSTVIYYEQRLNLQANAIIIGFGLIAIITSVIWMNKRNKIKSDQWIVENGVTKEKLDAAERKMFSEKRNRDVKSKIENELFEEENHQEYERLKNQIRSDRNLGKGTFN